MIEVTQGELILIAMVFMGTWKCVEDLTLKEWAFLKTVKAILISVILLFLIFMRVMVVI